MTWVWTDERVETLRKLWTDGLSASQIAGELGGITRNAVIGKVHRLGLSGRAKAPSTAVPRQRKPRAAAQYAPRAPRPAMRGNTALAQPAYAYLDYEAEPEQDPITDNIIPMGQRCSIVELTEATCRWPIGDPGSADFYFCGGKTVASHPYCAHHCRMAYQPVQDRRRARR